MDEAKRKGIVVDLDKLSKKLGVPVVGTTALKKQGLDNLMDSIQKVSNNDYIPSPIKITYDNVIEEAIKRVEQKLSPLLKNKLNTRWVALKLIDGEENLLYSIDDYLEFSLKENKLLIEEIHKARSFLNDNGINGTILKDKIVAKLVSIAENVANKVIFLQKKTIMNSIES